MKEYVGRILIIVQNLPVPFDRRVWLEAKTLREHGFKVTVICPKSEEYKKSYEVVDNVAIYRYSMPIEAHSILSYIFEFGYAWIRTALLSIKVLRREGFDVIQACNPPDTYFLLGLFYKLFGKEFVFDHHDLSPEMMMAKYHRKYRWLYQALIFLEKVTMKTAKVVMTTNETYREMAIKRDRKSPDDVFVVRTGPDLDKLVVMPPDSTLKGGYEYMVCYLGEMCPQDGVDYLLRTANYMINTLRRKDIKYVLIGGGPAVPALKKMADTMDLDGSVVFMGRLPDEEVSRYLSTADVCVDPDPWSEWADSSTMNKILEYMAFGKPIVAFDLKEIRKSAREAAEYIVPNDIRMFSLKITELLDDAVKRKRMGAFGRRRILRELAWEYNSGALIEAYERVFNKKERLKPLELDDMNLQKNDEKHKVFKPSLV